MNQRYRNIVEEADAAKVAARNKAQEEHQQRQEHDKRVLAEAKAWYETVFKAELEEANEAIREKQALFHVNRVDSTGPIVRCEFVFKRYQNQSHPYVLAINNGKYSLAQYIVPQAQQKRGLPATVGNVVENQNSAAAKYKNLSIKGDEGLVPEIVEAILRENLR